ncbi:MAG TPA: hypothetical protein VE130_00600 [Nitrososphaeraceae archaeon]|nr:hypothetical protein [Nitrososphaeraceae archaeon]
MKKGAFGRDFKNTDTITIVLLPSLLIVLAGSVVLNPNSVIKVAYAIEKFDIDIDIEHNEIERGDTQHVTVTVRNEDTNNRVSDADVRLTVDPPDSASSSATDETDDDGEARFDVKIDDDAETGNYDVDVRVSKNGYDTETVSTSFDVIRGDRGDESSVTVSASAAASASSSNAPSAAVGTGSASTGGGRLDSSPSGAAGASTSSDK